MTGTPITARRLPLTVADYLAIPENGEVRYELQEGIPIGSPSPPADHQICIGELMHQLRDQMPASLRGVSGVDIDLELAPAWRPGFVRRPDLVMVSRASLQRGSAMTASYARRKPSSPSKSSRSAPDAWTTW